VEDKLHNRDNPRIAHGKAMVSSVGSSISGLFAAAWAPSRETPHTPSSASSASSHPSHAGGEQLARDQDDSLVIDSHCLDCSYEWQVPVEIEPGRYLFRICPTGTGNNHRYSSSDQLQRSRESGWLNIV